MGVLGLTALAFGARHVHKRLKKNRANRRLAKEVEASVAAAVCAGESPYEVNLRDASLQEVLAMLVDGVYYRDHDDWDLGLIVKPLIEGEYEVDERMAHFTSSLYWTRMRSISEEEEKDVKIKHYIRHPRNPNKSAPRLVIAIRGTKLSKCQDVVDDIKIAMSTLHSSSSFEKGRVLVKKIIEEYAKWQRRIDDEDSSELHHRDLSYLLGPPVHQHFSCGVCRINPIIGPRYNFNKKENYDLCQICFLKHGSSEDYDKIDKRLGTDLEQTFSRLGLSSPNVQHPGVTCDGCDITPIIGTRYNSIKRGNFDLCEECFQKYGASKDYTKIDKPPKSENDMKLVLSRPAHKPVQHPRVRCDICDTVPIVGIRYKSIKKHNYDLCQQCFQKHGALEDYTKIEKPLESTSSGTSSSSSASEDDSIYITGHSLGATLALLIGKSLATEEKQRYNVHCFNPPFMTIVQLIQHGVFLPKAKDILRKTPLEPLIDAASEVKSLAKYGVAKYVMGKKAQLVGEEKHFKDLRDWVPVLYINTHDGICKKFRKYYKRKQRSVSSGFEVCSQALLSQVLGHRALFSSLVPSVDMCVSKQKDESHALKNWYRDPAIDEFSQYRLLDGVSDRAIDMFSQTYRLLPDEDFDLDFDEEFDLDFDEDSDLDSDEDSDLDSDEDSDLDSDEEDEETYYV